MTLGGVGGIGSSGSPFAGGFSDLARTVDIIEDALVLASSAVRLKVKNRLVVRALRDGGAYDEAWMLMAASLEFVSLASEKDGEVMRLDAAIQDAKAKHGRPEHPSDYRSIDLPALRRRRRTIRRLARRLRTASEEIDELRSLVSSARNDALHEIAIALRGGPRSVALHSHDEPAPQDRAAALAALLLDLADLTPVTATDLVAPATSPRRQDT